MAEHLYYFAYGSNMSLARIRQRVPSAEPLGIYSLAKHKLVFHMHGYDESAKCDATETGNDTNQVIGVLYRMHENEKPVLDIAENLAEGGYAIKQCQFSKVGSGEKHDGFLYYAKRIKHGLKPYDWYKHHVLNGAREAGLPEDYIAQIQSIESISDSDAQRQQQQMAIYSS